MCHIPYGKYINDYCYFPTQIYNSGGLVIYRSGKIITFFTTQWIYISKNGLNLSSANLQIPTNNTYFPIIISWNNGTASSMAHIDNNKILSFAPNTNTPPIDAYITFTLSILVY